MSQSPPGIFAEAWRQHCMEYPHCTNMVSITRGKYWDYGGGELVWEIERCEPGAEIYNKEASMVRCPACAEKHQALKQKLGLAPSSEPSAAPAKSEPDRL